MPQYLENVNVDHHTKQKTPFQFFYGPHEHIWDPGATLLVDDEVAEALTRADAPVRVVGTISNVPMKRTVIFRSPQKTWTREHPLVQMYDSVIHKFYDVCPWTEASDVIQWMIEKLSRRPDVVWEEFVPRRREQPSDIEDPITPVVIDQDSVIRRRLGGDLGMKFSTKTKVEEMLRAAWAKDSNYTASMMDDLGVRFARGPKGELNLEPGPDEGNVKDL